MRGAALGLIEAIGLGSAITALDAACKAADVTLVGYEKVIGAGKSISVTVQIVGEVAAVQAAVDAGVTAAERVGKVLSHRVIPRPHEDVDELIKRFSQNLKQQDEKTDEKKIDSRGKKMSEHVEEKQ